VSVTQIKPIHTTRQKTSSTPNGGPASTKHVSTFQLFSDYQTNSTSHTP